MRPSAGSCIPHERSADTRIIMSKYYNKDINRELEKQGYHLVGGSKHAKWHHESKSTVMVPRKLVDRHTANEILKTAGSSKRV